jgi:hypothetical protein
MMYKNKSVKKSDSPADTRRLRGSRSHGVKLATGHMHVTHQASCGKYATGETLRNKSKIGTWNVRGLLNPGKTLVVEKEMYSHGLDILGISETHWKNNGHYKTSNGNTIYFSGNQDSSHSGVAVILASKLTSALIGYNPISDRLIHLKLNTHPYKLNILQIYAPTADAEDIIINAFYASLLDTLSNISNKEMTIILGDFNAKVGNNSNIDNIVGKYGLGIQNERGEKLISFCIENKMSIMNTWFQHHPRRLYTWISPGDRHRNQIDYVLINSRWKSSIHNVKTYPGADCGSDHNLLVAKFRLKLKMIKRHQNKAIKLTNDDVINFGNVIREKDAEFQINPNVDVEESWKIFKDLIIRYARKHQTPQNEHRKSFISDSTWVKIKERKRLKQTGITSTEYLERYAILHKDIQRSCRRDKAKYINDICEEIEKHALKNQARDIFHKVKIVTQKFSPKTWTIDDQFGNTLTDIDVILNRWKEYCSELYSGSSSTSIVSLIDDVREPDILTSEVVNAIKKLKCKKSPGSDGIQAELLKELGETAIKALCNMCNKIWVNGVWPKDWVNSIFIPLHKKGSTKKCENYRTLALISHSSKVLLYIIKDRLSSYLGWQIPNEQAGFVKGKGTREQILNIRQLIEKCREFQTPAVLCFIDYKKAFDFVNWDYLWKVLLDMGVPMHLVKIIHNLYNDNNAVVRINSLNSTNFRVQRGVRQGCILSPDLFNIYGEYIMRRALDGWKGGVSIGGKKLSNLRYADDTTLIANNHEEMAELIRRVETESNVLGLQINRPKTKIMIIDRHQQLQNNNSALNGIDVVDNFVYLGSLISNNGGSELEIRRRITLAKSAMSQLTKIWKNRAITTAVKIRLVKSLVFSVCLYGVETWTMKAADRRRIDAFEMWSWRRLLRVPWTDKRTNVSILEELKIKDRLSTICLKRILQFFGHIARRGEESLERLVVVGSVEGRRARGRSPARWTDQVSAATGASTVASLRLAEFRTEWRQLVDRTS